MYKERCDKDRYGSISLFSLVYQTGTVSTAYNRVKSQRVDQLSLICTMTPVGKIIVSAPFEAVTGHQRR